MTIWKDVGAQAGDHCFISMKLCLLLINNRFRVLIRYIIYCLLFLEVHKRLLTQQKAVDMDLLRRLVNAQYRH